MSPIDKLLKLVWCTIVFDIPLMSIPHQIFIFCRYSQKGFQVFKVLSEVGQI